MIKEILLVLTFILAMVYSASAQSHKKNVIRQIQTLLLSEHPDSHDAVSWKDQAQSLQIGRYVIPVSEHTHTQINREKKSYKVEFLMQEGAVVTDASNDEIRKAYWTIPFSSQKACREFIELFEALRN